MDLYDVPMTTMTLTDAQLHIMLVWLAILCMVLFILASRPAPAVPAYRLH